MSDHKTRLRIKCNQLLPSKEDGCEDLVDDMLPNEGHQLTRAGMRLGYGGDYSRPHIEWLSDLGHGGDDWNRLYKQILGLATKYVGKPYDMAYSELVSKGLADKEYYLYWYGTGRDIWHNLFDEGYHHKFDVVNGVIVKVPQPPRKKYNWPTYPKPEPVPDKFYDDILKADKWARKHIKAIEKIQQQFDSYKLKN